MNKLLLLSACLTCFATTSFGLVCWECEESLGEAECMRKGRAVTCEADQEFCHLSLRHGGWGTTPWVEKTCKTRQSCADNYIQNVRSAWNIVTAEDQVQCNENSPSSVCRCCCSGDLCNQNQTSCLVVTHCPAIRKPRRGTMRCTDGYKLTSECAFTCQIGTALEGAIVTTCDAFGNWTRPVPRCEPITCIPLQTPRFGNQTCNRRRIERLGTRCRFTCQQGYRLFGRPEVQCVDDEDGDRFGQWTGYQPQCMPLQCARQRPLRHGTISCTDRNFVGSRCTFRCLAAEGYELFPAVNTPTVTINCQGNEQWSGDRPCCTLPCPPFAVMDFLVILDSSSSVGAQNWVRMRDFVLSFISEFTIRDDSTHVAAFRYNERVDTQHQIFFNSYSNNLTGLLQAFREIPYDGQGTRTGRAINHAIDNVLPVGNRELARDVVLLITDGASQDRVALPARRLRTTGALVYVLPIQIEGAARLNLDEFRAIAGREHPDHILTAALTGGFDALDENFARDVTSLLCNQPCFNPLHNHPDDARLP